ncbi:Gfo/Idh/MocA family oxidoreductase [Alphaproteobacteria bacterium]|nr:Gfo/Idh/MocA family oxidoreductase [Alphaproteobacteria bacterium]MDC1023173.1 Gfo/Idh/MocA family oxidoreductase [Alphaproteobacteria bacterium]
MNFKKNHNIQVALIGCGNWGKNIARNLSEMRTLACVYDPNSNIMKKVSNDLKLPIYSLNDIFLDKNINGVVIASSAFTHKDIAQQALLNNKDVLIEKPFCLSLSDAKSISSLAVEKNRILMAGHLLNYHNAFIKMRKLINEGKIGFVKNIRAHRLALGAVRANESVVYDLAAHDVSMVLSITKDLPIKLEVQSIHHNSNIGPDAINVKLSFNQNITALISCDWMCPYKEHRFSVIGTKGSLIFDDRRDWSSKLIFNPSIINQDNSINFYPVENIYVEKNEPLKIELQEFINSIQTRKNPITDHIEALKVQTVLEKIDKKLG